MTAGTRSMIATGLAVALLAACGDGRTASAPRLASPVDRVSSVPSPSPSKPHRFGSIRDAVAFIRSKVDVPVVLPEGLPPGIHLDPRHPVYGTTLADGTVEKILSLRFGRKGLLIIQYGHATFDGCGGDVARPVLVGAHHGMLNTFPDEHWVEVIWPATPGHLEGRYGLTGTFSARDILRLAGSMDARTREARRARPTPTQSPQIGC